MSKCFIEKISKPFTDYFSYLLMKISFTIFVFFLIYQLSHYMPVSSLEGSQIQYHSFLDQHSEEHRKVVQQLSRPIPSFPTTLYLSSNHMQIHGLGHFSIHYFFHSGETIHALNSFCLSKKLCKHKNTVPNLVLGVEPLALLLGVEPNIHQRVLHCHLILCLFVKPIQSFSIIMVHENLLNIETIFLNISLLLLR